VYERTRPITTTPLSVTNTRTVFEYHCFTYNPVYPEGRTGGEWLYDHGGLKIEDRDAFKKFIDAFRKTGNLQLPV